MLASHGSRQHRKGALGPLYVASPRMKRTLRIAMLGAGAIGGCVAADLALAGLQITVIDGWAAHVEMIRERGLMVETEKPEGGKQIRTAHMTALHVGEVASVRQPFDVIFLGVKSYDTRWATELVKPHLRPDGLFVGLQNGLCDEDIASIVGRHRTIGCVVQLAAETFEPGRILRRMPAATTWFGVGALDPAIQWRTPEIAALLERSAKVSVLDDVVDGKWTKLVHNAAVMGPVGLMGMTNFEALHDTAARDFMLRVASEAAQVMLAAGRKPAAVYGAPASELAGSVDEVIARLLTTMARPAGQGTRNAVLQDHLKGRCSEVDAINGVIVAVGRQLGIATPLNQRVVDVTSRIWSGAEQPGRHQLATLLA